MIGLNGVIMTMFLWHQTAMLLAVAVLYPLGFPQPAADSVQWWALRPVWIAALALCLIVLVALWGRFERGGLGEMQTTTHGSKISRTTSSVVGTALVLIGILGFAVSGFDAFATPHGDRLVFLQVNPLQNTVNILLGWLLMKQSLRDPRGAAAAGAVRALAIGLAALLFPGRAVSAILALETSGIALYGCVVLVLLGSLFVERVRAASKV